MHLGIEVYVPFSLIFSSFFHLTSIVKTSGVHVIFRRLHFPPHWCYKLTQGNAGLGSGK
jgi:hypothetical protein